MIKNKISWPNGARCAACLTFDMDADSLIHLEHGAKSYQRVSAISMLRYGPEVAVPRIVDTYQSLGIRQTFFIPAWCMQQYPSAVDLILKGGHEIAHHGFLHENPIDFSCEGEEHWLERGMQIHKSMTGQLPRGWRAPLYNFSNDSIDLLLKKQFSYDASLMGEDIPYVIESRLTGKQLIEIPSHWGLDDWPQFVHSSDIDYVMPVRAPKDGLRAFIQEFEAAYKYGGLWVPVLHPFTTGRLARWDAMTDFLEDLVGRGDVWLAPMEDIAEHVKRLIASDTWQPRVELLPQYPDPLNFD